MVAKENPGVHESLYSGYGFRILSAEPNFVPAAALLHSGLLCRPSAPVLLHWLPRAASRAAAYPPETKKPYILMDMEDELSNGRTGCMQSLYLTEHYLISLADGNLLFQPLTTICWVYTHKYFPGPLRRYHRGRLYITWWNRSGRHFDIPLPLESDGEALIDEIGERCPDILLHYNQQNRQAAEKILKKKI